MRQDELYCVTTYMVNKKVKDYTRRLINFLKGKGKEVLLISHYHIPIEFQETVDYCIYDSRNYLLEDNKYKGWITHGNSYFYVKSQEFFTTNSSLACFHFFSSLFFAKFAHKKIVHYIDYDSDLINIDQYEDNYQILKNSDYSSVRYKNNTGSLFADTSSVNLEKINLNNFLISDEQFKSLVEQNRTFEMLFENNFLKLENTHWKSFEDLSKTVRAGLEHVHSIDWVCLAVERSSKKLFIVIVNPDNQIKTHKIVFDDQITFCTTNNSSWLMDVSANKNIFIFNDKNILLKSYHVPSLDINEQQKISSINFVNN